MSFNWFRRWKWTTGRGVRKEVYLHLSWAGRREAWLALKRWLAYRSWLDAIAYLSNRPQQHECYCPAGRTTRLHVDLFGLCVQAELSRSWVRRPCLCTRISWCVFPENYQDDIEDYGRERLIAEFPEYATALEASHA